MTRNYWTSLQLLVERKRRELQTARNRVGRRTLKRRSNADVCPARNRRLAYFLRSALLSDYRRSWQWHGAWLKLLHATERSAAALLFALRVLPLAASVVITFVFVVPSFQLLEPRSIDEGMGAIPLALGICAFVLIVCGCLRVIAAQSKTARVVARWLEGAHPLHAGPSSRRQLRFAPDAKLRRSLWWVSANRECWFQNPRLRF